MIAKYHLGGIIYFGANDHNLYAVNASTGAILCSYTTPGNISSSPTIVMWNVPWTMICWPFGPTT